jgi:hypothetical protein
MFVDRMGLAKKFVDAYDNYIELKNLLYNKWDLDPRVYILNKSLRESLFKSFINYRDKAKELHYNRNIYNTNLPKYPWEAIYSDWEELPLLKSWFHQHTANISEPNRKFISNDGSKEVIYDENWKIVDDLSDIWTYNFFDPIREKEKHKIYDIYPYFDWWNGINDRTNGESAIKCVNRIFVKIINSNYKKIFCNYYFFVVF